MIDEMKVMEAKTLRGAVMEKLYLYGQSIRITTLKNALRARGYVNDDEIRKALDYLSGLKREYIHVEADEENWLDGIIRLNPDGINLVEGDKEDKGVIFNE